MSEMPSIDDSAEKSARGAEAIEHDRAPGNILNTIDEFLESRDQLESVTEDLNKYEPAITPEDLSFCLTRFRAGLEYVLKNYGPIAEHIYIANDVIRNNEKSTDTICYIPDKETDAIVITDQFLARLVRSIKNNFTSSSPHLDVWVGSADFATLLGVEEAHHSYFIKSGQGSPSETPSQYSIDPVELAAGEAMKQAIIDLNMTTTPRTK